MASLTAELALARGEATEIAIQVEAEAEAVHAGWVAVTNHLQVKVESLRMQLAEMGVSAEVRSAVHQYHIWCCSGSASTVTT